MVRSCRLLVACLALGCSSSKPPASDPSPTECSAPGYPSDSAPVTVDQVEASLRDASGAPVAGLPIQVCGLNQCFTDSSGPSGKVNVTPHADLLRPAFKYGDGFDFAELAVLLGSDATQNLGALVALPLPSFSEGAAFPKSGDVTNGEVTLRVAPGTTVSHDRLTYADDSELVLRSVPIPIAQSEQALDPSFGFELAFALAPLGTRFCPPAQLSLKNSLAWASGTLVLVFVQGLDVNEKWAPYGSWVQVAEAVVSSDGSRIETTQGGIPILSSIAVRRKP